MKGNSYQPAQQFMLPPRSLRVSDLYFPDPMFFPGYYPVNAMNPFAVNGRNHLDPMGYQEDLENYVNRRIEYDRYKSKFRKVEMKKEDPLISKLKEIQVLLKKEDERDKVRQQPLTNVVDNIAWKGGILQRREHVNYSNTNVNVNLNDISSRSNSINKIMFSNNKN